MTSDSEKTEAAEPTETKADETKADETKIDAVKAEDAKIDEAKAEDAKIDEAKAEDAKIDEAKAEDAKIDEAKADETEADDASTATNADERDGERRAKKAKKKARSEATQSNDAPGLGPKPLAWRPAYGLALLSGTLYFLCFPGIDLWPLSLVALVPLLIAMRGQTPRRAAGLGWVAGFTMTMTGFYWLLGMLSVFSGFPKPLCLLFMAILCGYQGGRIALAGWLYGRAARKGWPAPIVFALAFAASELLYPLLFPWYFGAAAVNALPLLQTAELGGPILVGLVLIAGNVAIAEIVIAKWMDKRAIDTRLVAIGAAIVAVAALFGVARIAMVKSAMEAAPAVKIGIVQPNEKLFGRVSSVPVLFKRTKELKDQGAQLVVWSEGAVPYSFPDPGYEAAVEKQITRQLGVPTIVGGLLRRDEPNRHVYFNTALMAAEGGKIVGRYDKEFLLAFGEYIPFGDAFPILYKWSPNSGQFSPGTSQAPLVWGDHRITTIICYEDILPSFVNRGVAAGDPDLIVNLTNDSWFGDSTEPWEHFSLAAVRAVEHRRFLVRATNSGLSGIVDATGAVVVHGKTFVEEAILGDARWMRSKTVYEVLGDAPWYLATLVVVAMGFVARKKKDGERAAA